MLECGLYHDENGYLCKSESWSLTCLKMVIRYMYYSVNLSTHFPLLIFLFQYITIANSFVERGGNVASAAVPVVVVIKY